MIAYVDGILEDITEENAVVDVGGLGYNVKISAHTAGRLPGIGEHIRLYTYTCVREDAFLLFGFLNRDELDIFKKCITVNGIGPKGALAILSVMDVYSLKYAIVSGDVKAISKAPGIGTKTAERLVLELKDKIQIDAAMIQREIEEHAEGSVSIESDQFAEALEALLALGYSRTESVKALKGIPEGDKMDAGRLLKMALKKLF